MVCNHAHQTAAYRKDRASDQEKAPCKFGLCSWRRSPSLPALQMSRVRARKPFPRGRCASSSAIPPAGRADIVARLIGQWLSERLGQPFVIENRPGAASNIATEAVVRAPRTATRSSWSVAANAINATLYDNLNFNFIRDIAPVAGIIRVPNVMVVNPSVPAKTVPEFIAYAKANPGKINYGVGGQRHAVHVAGELFKMMTGVNMVHVPYRGAAPALTDLLGGQVQVMFDNAAVLD